MRYLATSNEMKAIDRFTIDSIGIASMVLMERAAMSVAEEIIRMTNNTATVLVICGIGNNGADGIAIARMLFEAKYNVTIRIVGKKEKASKEWMLQWGIAKEIGIDSRDFLGSIQEKYDYVVDAIFGVGLDRAVEGIYCEAIESINSMTASYKISVDVPSGIHSDYGTIMGTAVHADKTITFGCCKLGMALYPGKEYCGQLIIKDIGFPKKSFTFVSLKAFTYDSEDLNRLPVRPPYSNKGTFGKVLIIAGSKNMSGAAYLSALAAYRMGAGLVRILTVEENRTILQSRLPEAILTVYDPEDIMEEGGTEEFFEEICGWATAIVLGPGLGSEFYVKRLTELVLMYAYVPMILDADALNAIAQYPYLTKYFTENIIVTPHLGEMARLTRLEIAEVKQSLTDIARSYSRQFGLTCVLKDAVTIVTMREEALFLNSSGSHAMAKGGSGDVLTGIIAGLLAAGLETCEAAALGVYLHGLAGDKARERLGGYSVLASDIADSLSSILGA